ncbi:MAG: VWA domain-containing protein [Acidobacteria bacterium]|nr:MAG: VWA domain-containing protein [Acidobacteriota bacterium]
MKRLLPLLVLLSLVIAAHAECGRVFSALRDPMLQKQSDSLRNPAGLLQPPQPFPAPHSGWGAEQPLFLRAAMDGSDSGTSQEPESTVKVDVKLVNVFVTVTDEHGSPIANLKKDDFHLREDGKEQKISVFGRESALPLSIVLAIDTSLSTRKDLPLELTSARRFSHAILRPVDALSLYQFSEVVNEVSPFTSDVKQIDRAIDRIRLGAATALYDALYLGSQALDTRQGRKVMVVITDGGDTASKVDYKEAVRAAQEAEAIVYSIIVVPIEESAGRDTGGEHALIQLSTDTGGKYFYAGSLPQLDDAFKQISDELRTQYLLAYYPSQRYSDSSFRRIQVSVTGETGSPYKIRHRAGYYTTKSKW